MPLNSVQQHLRTILSGLTPPNYETVVTYITPPIPGDATVPSIFIWGAHLRESRQTMPRYSGSLPPPLLGRPNSGFKELTWEVSIWPLIIESLDPNYNKSPDQSFPLFIDLVMDTLRTADIPVFITDPTTNSVTQLISIGEEMEMEYAIPRTISTQSQVEQIALITCTVKEVIQS